MKSPSQSAMDTIIAKGKSSNKPLVVAGCVPQGSRGLKELEGISIVGVQQIDRVVEVVEETLKGHEVRLLTRRTLPALDLPKVSLNNMHIFCSLCLEISFLPQCISLMLSFLAVYKFFFILMVTTIFFFSTCLEINDLLTFGNR